jgi:hypothetical protein
MSLSGSRLKGRLAMNPFLEGVTQDLVVGLAKQAVVAGVAALRRAPQPSVSITVIWSDESRACMTESRKHQILGLYNEFLDGIKNPQLQDYENSVADLAEWLEAFAVVGIEGESELGLWVLAEYGSVLLGFACCSLMQKQKVGAIWYVVGCGAMGVRIPLDHGDRETLEFQPGYLKAMDGIPSEYMVRIADAAVEALRERGAMALVYEVSLGAANAPKTSQNRSVAGKLRLFGMVPQALEKSGSRRRHVELFRVGFDYVIPHCRSGKATPKPYVLVLATLVGRKSLGIVQEDGILKMPYSALRTIESAVFESYYGYIPEDEPLYHDVKSLAESLIRKHDEEYTGRDVDLKLLEPRDHKAY